MKLNTAAQLDMFSQLYDAGFMCDCSERTLEEYADHEGQENVLEVIVHAPECRATESLFKFFRRTNHG